MLTFYSESIMQLKSYKLLSVLITIFLFINTLPVTAEEIEKSSEGHLAYITGVYLAANQYLITLKNSQCDYLVSRNPLSFDEFLNSVIIPQIPSKLQPIIKEKASLLKQTVETQSRQVIQQQIYSTSKIPSLDTPKAQCAYVAGIFIGIYFAVKVQWDNEIAYYNVHQK